MTVLLWDWWAVVLVMLIKCRAHHDFRTPPSRGSSRHGHSESSCYKGSIVAPQLELHTQDVIRIRAFAGFFRSALNPAGHGIGGEARPPKMPILETNRKGMPPVQEGISGFHLSMVRLLTRVGWELMNRNHEGCLLSVFKPLPH